MLSDLATQNKSRIPRFLRGSALRLRDGREDEKHNDLGRFGSRLICQVGPTKSSVESRD